MLFDLISLLSNINLLSSCSLIVNQYLIVMVFNQIAYILQRDLSTKNLIGVMDAHVLTTSSIKIFALFELDN